MFVNSTAFIIATVALLFTCVNTTLFPPHYHHHSYPEPPTPCYIPPHKPACLLPIVAPCPCHRPAHCISVPSCGLGYHHKFHSDDCYPHKHLSVAISPTLGLLAKLKAKLCRKLCCGMFSGAPMCL